MPAPVADVVSKPRFLSPAAEESMARVMDREELDQEILDEL